MCRSASATAVVIDPRLFGGLDAFTAETGFLAERVLGSRPADPQRPVRLPGQAGLKLREQALRDGVSLSPAVLEALDQTAAQLHLTALTPN